MAKNKPGFVLINWCGDTSCENKVKEELGLKSRYIPFGNEKSAEPCAICGKEGKCKIYFGKQY